MVNKKTTRPLVSIVVLNWNGLEDTKICLDHIRKLTYTNYEVILVDNGSKPQEKHYLSQLPDITYINNSINRGFTGGHIDGLSECSGDYILLLNNDAVIKADYIDAALATFATDPSIAAVGGKAFFWNEDNPILDETNPFYSYQQIDIFTAEARMLQSDYGLPQEVNNISGSAVIIKRSVINEIGYLYEPFFAYFEETDLFARIKRAGYKIIYNPKLCIWHRNGASSGASSGSHFFYYQIFRNRFIFAVRNFEPWFLRRFIVMHFKIGLISTIQIWRDPTNAVMHKAYARAALSTILLMPQSFITRLKLTKQIGKTDYNHRIFSEQTGVSYVINCKQLNIKQLDKLRKTLEVKRQPLCEYVLVVSSNIPPHYSQLKNSVRCVIDKGYFKTNPVNLGCIAAQHQWMVVADPDSFPDPTTLKDAIKKTLGKSTEVIAFGDKTRRTPYVLLNKYMFERMGGFTKHDTQEALQHLLWYSNCRKTLLWHTTAPSKNTVLHTLPTKAEDEALIQKLSYDETFIKTRGINLFSRIRNKYYRVHQIACLIQWIFMPSVSLRLKLARMKNITLFTIKFDQAKLALELRHIRNDVTFRNKGQAVVAKQVELTRKALSVARKNITSIPVFIICFERREPLKKLLQWLESQGMTKIILIDNDSSYPPLLDILNTTDFQQLRLYRNIGHTAPWSLNIIRILVPDQAYIVTDPDVIPSATCPGDVLSHFIDVHEQFFDYKKVGFGLRINDLPNHFALKDEVITWESQFWKQEIAPSIFEAGVDTTFAIYKPFTYDYTLHPSIRTGEPYTAQHLPWYDNPKKLTEEDIYYRFRADRNITSWNIGSLPERYAKEMRKTSKK